MALTVLIEDTPEPIILPRVQTYDMRLLTQKLLFPAFIVMATQQQVNVSLKKFDMKRIPQDAVAIFIGRRRTGKSTLVRDLLFHHQDMPLGTVISGTEESNSFYSKMIPPLFIHGEYSALILANFCKRQKMMMAKIQRELAVNPRLQSL